MPKMKTHRGAAKRFKITPTGKIRRRRAFANHILEKKSPKRKRRLNAPDAVVSPADRKMVRRLLGK
jgi:large subunit ribosomal protein L35